MDLGLFQARVAERIGVTESTVWNWEHGISPKSKHQLKIMQFLGEKQKSGRPDPLNCLKKSLWSKGSNQKSLSPSLIVCQSRRPLQ